MDRGGIKLWKTKKERAIIVLSAQLELNRNYEKGDFDFGCLCPSKIKKYFKGFGGLLHDTQN